MKNGIKIWVLRAQILWLKLQICAVDAMTRRRRKRLELLQKGERA